MKIHKYNEMKEWSITDMKTISFTRYEILNHQSFIEISRKGLEVFFVDQSLILQQIDNTVTARDYAKSKAHKLYPYFLVLTPNKSDIIRKNLFFIKERMDLMDQQALLLSELVRAIANEDTI